MKVLLVISITMLIIAGCSNDEIYCDATFGRKIMISWEDNDYWVYTTYKEAVMVKCYKYRYYPSLLGAARHEYIHKWSQIVPPRSVVSVGHIGHNDKIEIYNEGGLEIIQTLHAKGHTAVPKGVCTSDELQDRKSPLRRLIESGKLINNLP